MSKIFGEKNTTNKKHIEINIGMACNNKCRFCMSGKSWIFQKKLTDKQLVFEEINKYSKRGYTSIGFLGGDISIHPGVYEILSYSREKGFKEINIITNSMVYCDYKKALKLVESGATRINISLHSHESEIDDYLTQVPGGLSKKLEAINNFNKLYELGILKTPISINIVLNGLNYKKILQTCIFYSQEKSIKEIRINYIWPRYFYSQKDSSDLFLKYIDFLPFLKKLIYFSLKYNVRISFDSIPACIFYRIFKNDYKIIINKFMGEYFDRVEEISNINNKISFNWKKQKKDHLKSKPDLCIKCVYNSKCLGIWNEYLQREGGKEFIPIKKLVKYE